MGLDGPLSDQVRDLQRQVYDLTQQVDRFTARLGDNAATPQLRFAKIAEVSEFQASGNTFGLIFQNKTFEENEGNNELDVTDRQENATEVCHSSVPFPEETPVIVMRHRGRWFPVTPRGLIIAQANEEIAARSGTTWGSGSVTVWTVSENESGDMVEEEQGAVFNCLNFTGGSIPDEVRLLCLPDLFSDRIIAIAQDCSGEA